MRPSELYIVDKEWLKRFKAYVLYKTIKSYAFDRMTYLAKLTVLHMETAHPGRISNERLIKDFGKYLRIDDPSDSSNFAIKGKFRDTVDFKLVSRQVWELL